MGIFLNIKRSILGALIHPPFFGMTVIVSALWEICCAGDDVRAEPLGFGFGVGDDPDTHVGLDIEGYDVACSQLGAPQRG
jgi:hypothetical protein